MNELDYQALPYAILMGWICFTMMGRIIQLIIESDS